MRLIEVECAQCEFGQSPTLWEPMADGEAVMGLMDRCDDHIEENPTHVITAKTVVRNP